MTSKLSGLNNKNLLLHTLFLWVRLLEWLNCVVWATWTSPYCYLSIYDMVVQNKASETEQGGSLSVF